MAALTDLLCQVSSMRASSGSSVSAAAPILDSERSKYIASASARTHSRRCGFPECQKTAKRGGLCISHGGGKKCSVEGCTTSVVSRGFCVAHGGGKRCQAPACTKSAQTGGFCWIHGGGKKCGYQGCKKRAQSGGACISHGGGKRCRIEGCNKVVQYDGLCVGHGGYRKCLSINCDKRALANSYCQAHGGNSMCRVVGCHNRAIRGGICSEHKAQMPVQATRSSSAFAHCRPSIDLAGNQDPQFKVEPTAVLRTRLDQYHRYPTPLVSKASSELRGPSTYGRMRLSMDADSPPADEHVLSPLQYVRQGSSSLLDDGRTMVTPISRHFNAGERYDPYGLKRQSLPLLPSFQTLQRSCSSSPGSDMESVSSGSNPNQPNEDVVDQKWTQFPPRTQSRPDNFLVALGTAYTHTCSVANCARHAKRSGLCLLHSIVAAPK
ncbi:WRKY transcription factor 19 [Phytophthora cinnamomi]|uniref:WRKY transcription factor 19 n=1 Tax=Phytophthora cinnamomi TaxID=4785 RepID=UPI00355A986A|nr:WRKY transcription factor 19 [Phytophthora cinnamomi]